MKGGLFRFRKEVVDISIECQTTDALDGNDFLGNDLGRIEQVKIETVLVFLFDNLNAEFPLGIVAALYRFPQVATMKVGILSGDLLRLVPHDGMQAEQWLPVKLHKARLAPGIDETKRVNAKTFHHAKASGNRTIG